MGVILSTKSISGSKSTSGSLRAVARYGQWFVTGSGSLWSVARYGQWLATGSVSLGDWPWLAEGSGSAMVVAHLTETGVAKC